MTLESSTPKDPTGLVLTVGSVFLIALIAPALDLAVSTCYTYT